MSVQKPTPGGALGGFLGFIGLSAIAGILAAAAVTPAIAVTGMTASSTIGIFENLPDYLELGELQQKTDIVATEADGSEIILASFYDQNREEVAWDQVSQFAKDAAVATEDPRFYEHGGVDLQGTIRGALTTAFGGGTQGGSSITQQYVKNVLVQKAVSLAEPEDQDAAYEEATKTTADRKLKEMRLAIGLEKKYSKDEILLGYLNIALFGGRTYGIEAAARYYFNVSAAELNAEQAATLIAIVNNPDNLRIDRPDSEENGAANGYAATLERRDYVLEQMLKYDKITQEQYDVSIATPIAPVITPSTTGCSTAGGAAYFCDYVTWVIRNDPAFGETEDDRYLALQRGGFTVYTTIDMDLQRAADQAVTSQVPSVSDRLDVGGSAVSVQAGTGRILAMAQNRAFSDDPDVLAQGPQYTAINYNTDQSYGGSSGFQPGSTYKVFTLAEWLKEGHSLNERVDSRRQNWTNFRDSCNGTQYYSAYNPKNDANESGSTYTALQATTQSINTAFIGMAHELDLCGIRKTAESLGVHRADGGPLEQGASAVLGTNEIAPLSMATAFAGIASGGVVCDPVAIDRILNPRGEEIAVPAANCRQALDPNVAATMAYAMQRVMSGTAAASVIGDGIPVIGKTGTSDNNEATWMSGASTSVATVVGVYNATGHVNLRNTWFDSGSAATARHRIWPQIQEVANVKYGGASFAAASNDLLNGVQVTVPDTRGMSLEQAEQTLSGAGFVFEDGGQRDSELSAGQVMGSEPAAGSTSGRGSLVTVFTSNGAQTVVPDVVGMSESDAINALAQFIVRKQEQAVQDPSKVGKVLSQDPASGAVSPGSTVTIVVGKAGNGNGNGNGNGGNG